MKNIVFPFLLLTFSFIAQFQELGNYQNLTTLSTINPAFSGERSEVSGIYNKYTNGSSQLIGINYNSNASGFQLSHFSKKLIQPPYIKEHSTTLQYAQLIILSIKLNLRLGAGIAQNTYISKYGVIRNKNLTKNTQFTGRIGGVLESKKFYIGLSGLNIPFNNNELSYYNKNILSVHSGINIYIKENVVTPSLLFINYTNGYNVLYNLKAKRKWLELNLGYSNQNNLIAGIGIILYRFNFYYSYEQDVSKLTLATNNKHSFQLTYKLKDKDYRAFFI